MLDQLPMNKGAKRFSLQDWLHKVIFKQKLLNPAGIVFYIFMACFFGVAVARLGSTNSILLLVALIGAPTAYCIIAHPKFGIVILLIAAYFIMFSFRFIVTTFPLGTIMDMLEAMLILGFFIKQKVKPNYDVFKNPISYMILIWVGYNILEAGNPSATSRLAWVYTVRTVAFVTLMYFIFLYNITSVKYIRLLVLMWIVLSIIGALYGIKQELLGFSAAEKAALAAEPERAALYFQAGHWRKFSIFNDPVVFAYNMVLSALLVIGLSWGVKTGWKKFSLISLAFIFFIAMIFSGTRGAFALIPVGMILFCILNFNRKIMIFSIIGALGFVVLIFMPTSNPNILRFQTAFKPGKDASYLLRQQNQEKIKPFIQTHPMGGGLGSVGVWGQKFSPGTMLANFPPDSGYVRVAVEMGTIGILLFCTMMFVILRTGVTNFFLIKNIELKSYCLAMTCMIFAINVGNYPQEALVQFPTNIYFFLMVAIVNKCLELDRQLGIAPPKEPNLVAI